MDAGLFKRFNLAMVTNPNIAGNVATETMADGQQLFIQTLLPKSASITAFNGAANLNPIADLEPTRYILTVQDPSLPTDTRFLHVLQGADAGAAMTGALYVASYSGVGFDGAVFGSSAVFFPVKAQPAMSTGAMMALPAGVHTVLVAGLAPNGTYSASLLPNGGGNVLSVASGTGYTADAAGVLRLTF